MKALSFRRVSLVIGLAVGIMALWAAATPTVVTADSFIGGWVAYDGCCNDDTYDYCANNPYGCGGGDTWVCIGRNAGDCTPNGHNECTGTHYWCSHTSDSYCYLW